MKALLLVVFAAVAFAITAHALSEEPHIWTYPSDSPYRVQPPQWHRVTEYYVNLGPARQPFGPGMVTTCLAGITGCKIHGAPFGTWLTVDLTQPPWKLPDDAAWADVQGIGGMTGGPGDFVVVYRAPGDESVTCSMVPHASVQMMSPTSGQSAGTRQNATVRVPLVGGKFELCWLKDSRGHNATYFWNPSIIGWGRVAR